MRYLSAYLYLYLIYKSEQELDFKMPHFFYTFMHYALPSLFNNVASNILAPFPLNVNPILILHDCVPSDLMGSITGAAGNLINLHESLP